MIREAEIDAQMRRILESSIFNSAARSRQFLEFCVDRARRGEASHLKETTIAVEVFLRSADYDPKIDPIVRVHARRVREKLEQYYRTAGSADPIRIDLPKGGYVPQILRTLPQRKTEFGDWPEELKATHEAVDDVPAAPSQKLRGLNDSGSMQSPWNWARVGAVLAGVALVSFTLAWFWRGGRGGGTTVDTLSPVETVAGNATNSAWSPDGTMLAMSVVARGEQTPHIYLQKMRDGDAPVRLTRDTQPESRPVWSPDGKEIAFTRRIDLNHFQVVRFGVASHGNQEEGEQVVGRFISYWPVREDDPALDWSPDGRFLLTAEQPVPSNPMRLVLVSLATGERTSLTSPPSGSSGDIEAKFSPDGRWVAFRRGGLGDLYVVSAQGEQVRPATRLTLDNKGVRGIAWTDGGRSILFGAQRGPTAAYGVWKVAKDGGPPEPVSPQEFDAINPAISASGRLVFEHRQVVTELAEHRIGAGFASAPVPEHVLLPSDKTDSSPAYSPDGRSVAFTSTRTGWGEIWIYREGEGQKGDSGLTQLTHLKGDGLVFAPMWAPDGRSIAYSLRKDGATNIMIYDLAANTSRAITSTRLRDFSPVYSSDGRYIFYSSNEDGTSRVWRTRSDGSSRPEPLFLEAGSGFLPSPDGRWLYFLHEEDGLVLSRRDLIDGTTQEILRMAGRTAFVNDIVMANHRVCVGVSEDDLTADVFEVDPDTKSSRRVAHLTELPAISESGLTGFSISPDGQRLVVSHNKRSSSTLYTLTAAH